ncbi:MAG: integrin, partial [Vicinamibacterales bacterium]
MLATLLAAPVGALAQGPATGPAIAGVTYIKASNPDEDDRFGAGDPLMGLTVALSKDGTTLAVAAPHESSAAAGINGDQSSNAGFDTGAVYVFVKQAGRWSQQAYIKASNAGDWDLFGFSLALSADGNTLAVSAPREDGGARGINGNEHDNSAEEAGAAYVFVRRDGVWTQQAYVKASNTDAADQFGFSLALSADGHTLAVGAEGEGSSATSINGDQTLNAGPEFGAVYVFTRDGTQWSQQAYVKASNAQAADRFGFCLALSNDGNALAVCGYDEDGGSTGVNGNLEDNSSNGSGAAYLFVRRGTTWTQEAYFKASNTGNADAFGSSIALSGDGQTMAVCAADEDVLVPGINGNQEHKQESDHSAGAVFVF